MAPLTFEQARALFPALEKRAWLNAAASSPGSSVVLTRMKAHLDETLESGDLGYPTWLRSKEAVRARLARFIGATRPQDVAFTPSTSFGFHLIAQCLKARGLTEVLALESEFPSTTVPLLNAGLTIRAVRRRSDGSAPVEDYEAALRPTTKAVAASVVQFDSGYRVDLDGLSKLCRDRGLPLILNAAQAIGQVPLEVERLGAAFMAGTSHKWLAATYGLGLFYAQPQWLEGTLPLAGWLSVAADDLWLPFPSANRVDDANGFVVTGARTRHDASALEAGAIPWVTLHALDAALELQEALTPAAILEHNLGLQAVLRKELRARGFTPNAPDDPAVGSGICVINVEGDPATAVRELLQKRSVATTPRGGGVRISTHLFNNESDVQQLISAIDQLGIRPPMVK